MATVKGVVRELVSGYEWFGDVSLEGADIESLFGVDRTDIVTVSNGDVRIHFPLVMVAIIPCDECPEDATAL